MQTLKTNKTMLPKYSYEVYRQDVYLTMSRWVSIICAFLAIFYAASTTNNTHSWSLLISVQFGFISLYTFLSPRLITQIEFSRVVSYFSALATSVIFTFNLLQDDEFSAVAMLGAAIVIILTAFLETQQRARLWALGNILLFCIAVALPHIILAPVISLGQFHDILLYGTPIGAIIVIVALSRVIIHHHKQVISAFEQGSSRYLALFEQSNDAVLLVDLTGKVFQCNQVACEMFGYDNQEMIGLMYYDFVNHESEFREDANQIFTALTQGQKFDIYERQLRKKSGDNFPSEISVTGVKDEAGNVIHIQSVVRDISARKQLEQQQIQLAAENRQNQALRALIDGLSHDLRTPLTIINSSLYLVERYDDPFKKEAKIKVIREQVDHLSKSVEDTLEIAHLENITEILNAPVKLNETLERVQRIFASACNKKEVTLKLELNADNDQILGDDGLLKQMFKRLLDNACKFSNENKAITIKSMNSNQHVIIEVIDQGKGIEPENLEKIFGHFYRSDESRLENTGASGLGLTLVKRIVELHNATIEVESEVGVGTTFRLRFLSNTKI